MASALYVDDIYLGGKIGLPLGFVYTQLPGTPDPDDLFTGTWENVSATFAGDFFRAEGGDASAFDAGEQADQMQKITGRIGSSAISTEPAGTYRDGSTDLSEGAFTDNLMSGTGQVGSNSSGYKTVNWTFDSSDSPDARVSSATDGETRPINHTVRVWRRTS